MAQEQFAGPEQYTEFDPEKFLRDIKIQAELILHMKKQMAELTAEQTGKSLEQILKDNDRDHWFTAEEAREYGFIDRVITGSEDMSGESALN